MATRISDIATEMTTAFESGDPGIEYSKEIAPATYQTQRLSGDQLNQRIGVKVRVELTDAQVKDMHIAGNPVEIVPAPGAGKAWAVNYGFARLDYATTPYDSGSTKTSLILGPSAEYPNVIAASYTNFLDSSSSRNGVLIVNFNSSNDHTKENEPVELYLVDQATTGDSGIVVDVWLYLVDV